MSAALTFVTAGDERPVHVEPGRLIVAGYTGRDQIAVRQHIDELAAQGIAPPASVPTFFDLDPALLTTSGGPLTVPSSRTSGEVEPVYVRGSGRWYLGVGSDHTDRLLERADISRAKASCVKPVGSQLLALSADLPGGGFDASFDEVAVSCWVDGAAYQRGNLASLRPPSDVLARLFATLDLDEQADLVVFGGTIPLTGGAFVFGASWRLTLDVPAGPSLEHTYSVTCTLPG